MNDEIRLVSELTGDTYKNSAGKKIAVIKIENNVLMTAKEIARLYGVFRSTIYRRLKGMYKDGQLNKKEVLLTLTHRAGDGKLYRTNYYNFPAIIAIGQSLKSPEAENFTNWLGTSKIKKITQ